MNIRLLINRIILEDGDLSPSQRRRLQEEIETELTHLLTIHGIPNCLRFGGTVSDLSVNLNNISSTTHHTQLGQNIAHSIYSELNK